MVRQIDRQSLSRLMEIFADSLGTMDDRELHLLLQGKGTLAFTPIPVGRKPSEPKPDFRDTAEEIARQLKEADSRQVAKEIIASIDHPQRRDFLLLVAQVAGVRVASKDSIARIEQKLIQFIVGSKLRSRAFKEVAF